MGHFKESGRGTDEVIYVFHVIEVSYSKFLQELGDLILCCRLKQIKVFVLLVFAT